MLFDRCKDRKITTLAREAAQRAPVRPAARDFAAGAVALLAGALMLGSGPIWAQNLAAAALAPSLKRVPVPEPADLSNYVKNKATAIALGKALFWDMQVGSDAVQACASCHYQAGADIRFKNAVSPGLNAGHDITFQSVPPNGTLSQDKFPFTKFTDPGDNTTPLSRDWNDVVSSPGVRNTSYVGQPLKGAVEQGTSVSDPDGFSVNGVNVRRVEPRNAPTVVNAVFNFNNFWDGRADSIFNGSSPLGDADPDAAVWETPSATPGGPPVPGAAPFKRRVRIPFSSLASQAVGPPGSPFEMSFGGRSFPEIGKKLLNPNLVPLAQQIVHPKDSVLGGLGNSTIGRRGTTLKAGLNTTYATLVRGAFQDKFWNGGNVTLGQATYTEMEANFALFFGLAVQLYEATLVSDDSPYDRFQDCAPPQLRPDGTLEPDTRSSCDPGALSASAQQGLNIFLDANDPGGVGGNCINCHGTATFSNASVMHLGATNFGTSLPEALLERMIMGDGGGSWYDSGYYDIAIRPIPEDLGRGGIQGKFTGLRDKDGNPLKDADGNDVPIPLSFTERALLKAQGVQFPSYMDPALIPTLPCGVGFQLVCPSDTRVSTKGAFKVPTLRNVELTGPYMHNGGEATLMHVIDFYSRGGNFPEANTSTFDPDVNVLCGLNPTANPLFCPDVGPDQAVIAEANQNKLVDFLLALTDERVKWEKAPFDHPSLAIPNGATIKKGSATDIMLNLPAVGADGRAAEGLSPLGTFLNLDPHSAP